MFENEADKQAKLCGGTLGNGINWSFAYFDGEENAKAFESWLNLHGWDHRGIYPPFNDEKRYTVRYR